MPTVAAVDVVSAIPKPRAEASDDSASAANGLRITTLMELESWCSDDWPDCEYWRCMVMAAAVDLGSHAEDLINHRVALVYLRGRRLSLTDLFRHDANYKDLEAAADHANDVISDEINGVE